MKPVRTLIFAALMTCAAAASAVTGKLGTLPLGNYVCSEPGDAGGAAWVPLEGKSFTIANGSTYHTPEGSGTYLLAGKSVTFTRGPMKGMRFERTGRTKLRWVDANAKLGRIRCIRETGSY